MPWYRPVRRWRSAGTGEPWSPEDVDTLAEALRRAPTVRRTQPWSLEVSGRTAVLLERRDPAGQQQDGRERLFSSGAALANLVLAVHALGWATEVVRMAEAELPGRLAQVTGTLRRQPGVSELQLYRAIVRRRSYRRPFEGHALSHLQRDAIAGAAARSVSVARWIVGANEAYELAALLSRAVAAHRDDRACRQELGLWAASGDGDGVQPEAIGEQGLPGTGPVVQETQLPDRNSLAQRIEGESVLFLATEADGRLDHLLAGEGMQRAWLSATSLGLVGSVMTQPLRLPEVREGLTRDIGIPGVPQLLLRFGYPTGVSVPGSPRRSPGEPDDEWIS